MTAELLCQAIRTRSLLAFEYRGHARIVAPYAHGTSRQGHELLRAVQLAGSSRLGGLGFGKLWRVDEIRDARLTGDHFVPDDPDYNPQDRAMAHVHCHV